MGYKLNDKVIIIDTGKIGKIIAINRTVTTDKYTISEVNGMFFEGQIKLCTDEKLYTLEDLISAFNEGAWTHPEFVYPETFDKWFNERFDNSLNK